MVVPQYYPKEIEPKPIKVSVEQPPKKLGKRTVEVRIGLDKWSGSVGGLKLSELTLALCY